MNAFKINLKCVKTYKTPQCASVAESLCVVQDETEVLSTCKNKCWQWKVNQKSVSRTSHLHHARCMCAQ